MAKLNTKFDILTSGICYLGVTRKLLTTQFGEIPNLYTSSLKITNLYRNSLKITKEKSEHLMTLKISLEKGYLFYYDNVKHE